MHTHTHTHTHTTHTHHLEVQRGTLVTNKDTWYIHWGHNYKVIVVCCITVNCVGIAAVPVPVVVCMGWLVYDQLNYLIGLKLSQATCHAVIPFVVTMNTQGKVNQQGSIARNFFLCRL